jgi:hypothetical protein
MYRIHQSRFLERPVADFELYVPFAYSKHHLSEFVQVAFLDAQAAENELAWPFQTLKHCFIDFSKVVF